MYDKYILDKSFFIQVIKDLAAMVEEQRDYLTSLDAIIGDSDHGINLTIGFREVMKNLATWESEDLTVLFKKVGMALLAKVGGASGPLYGGFFVNFGIPAEGKQEVNFAEFVNMYQSGVELIEKRGKAVLADKTMVDTLRPALDALLASIAAQEEPLVAFEKCLQAAEVGRDSTKPLIAKKGRALRLGERAIGHLDPGATSSHLILSIFYENLKKQFS